VPEASAATTRSHSSRTHTMVRYLPYSLISLCFRPLVSPETPLGCSPRRPGRRCRTVGRRTRPTPPIAAPAGLHHSGTVSPSRPGPTRAGGSQLLRRFLLPERHPRLGRSHVSEIVRVAACREGDRLQQAPDAKFLKRVCDTQAWPAVGRTCGEHGVRDKLGQRKTARTPQLPPAQRLT